MIDSCKVCNKSSFKKVISFDKGYFSDGNKLESLFVKEECSNCGTIRTKLETRLDAFYKNYYNPSRSIDTFAISNDEEITRSTFIYNWIIDLITDSDFKQIDSIMEIGCGQGYLLDKFKIPNKYGVEPSIDASAMAKDIADVRNIGFENIAESEQYDFTLSYCVIEHIENPNKFLEKNYNILNDDGVMCIALPIQDKFNYDLLFVDHIHHFNHKNFTNLLANNGFEVENYELGRGSYSNIAMYICKKGKKKKLPFEYIKNKNLENVNIVIKNINSIIEEYKDKKLYAFGYGEITKTILPYTDLDRYIENYIDDYSIEEKVINSSNSKELFKPLDVINLILLVNPFHSEIIKNLYADVENINFIDIFENIDKVKIL
ncbi:MAG: methyltransferase domain-containing protein [Sulfurimonas sp.]|nr:methyltransferase domain-containing protein [Sulfurimonas sp.]